MGVQEGSIPISKEEWGTLSTWPEGTLISICRRDPGEKGPLIVTSDTGEWLLEDGLVTPLG